MNMLRRALEDSNTAGQENDTDKEQTVVMKGPLSEVFTNALDIAYAKETPAEGEQVTVLESQQMDAAVMRKLTEAMKNTGADPESIQTVYAVSQDTVEEQTIVEVTNELANKQEGNDFVLIIDAVGTGVSTPIISPTERVVELSSALECMVNAHGGKVYTSLSAYAASL